MKNLLHCYFGEMDGKKKVAVPRMYADKSYSNEYDIYTIETEKKEDDIKARYILKQDVDAVYNRRNFNTKKFKFNSLNFKDYHTLERSHRVLMIELENKAAIYVAGKIVSENPILVEDGTFVEIARNYEFNDSMDFISRKISRYIDEVQSKGEQNKTNDSNIAYWKDDALTADDLNLSNLNVNFIGSPIYSKGLTTEFLGYSSDIGLSTYEEGAAESHIIEELEKVNQHPIFGMVIYKDFIRILVDEAAYVIQKEGDWKFVITELVSQFTKEFKVKNTVILQQVEERTLKNNQKNYIFKYVLKKSTICK